MQIFSVFAQIVCMMTIERVKDKYKKMASIFSTHWATSTSAGRFAVRNKNSNRKKGFIRYD
jgi:hypothetical protein